MKVEPKRINKPGRCLIEVDPSVANEVESIRAKLGNPMKITFNTAALRHVIRQVKAGELSMVNGDLRPVAKAA